MHKKIAIGSLIIILALVNWSIAGKEKHLAEGKEVYLELAPVDPRSLMQGDYMALRFSLANEVYKALPKTEEHKRWQHDVAASDSFVVTSLNERNIGTFKSLYEDQPLSNDEILLRYRVRNGAVKFATNAYFFQEGHGKYYQPARYGQFRVDDKGKLLLVAMYDKELNKLEPGEKDIYPNTHITDGLDSNTEVTAKKISKQPNNEKGEKDIYPNIHIPEFKGALDVKRTYDYSNLKEVLKYYIDLPYPPNELISYYDDFFSKIGLKIYGNSGKQWHYIKNVPRIYESNWVDDNKYIKAHLGIKYEHLYGNNKYIGYVLKVSCQVKPFLAWNKCIEFNKRIKDTDEGQKLLQFTVKYSKNGVFDFDKALEMNPDNELLKEFIVIQNNNRDEINQKYHTYIEQLDLD